MMTRGVGTKRRIWQRGGRERVHFGSSFRQEQQVHAHDGGQKCK